MTVRATTAPMWRALSGQTGRTLMLPALRRRPSCFIMKVFGNSEDSASETMLLAALEDAVLLGADVINIESRHPRRVFRRNGVLHQGA